MFSSTQAATRTQGLIVGAIRPARGVRCAPASQEVDNRRSRALPGHAGPAKGHPCRPKPIGERNACASAMVARVALPRSWSRVRADGPACTGSTCRADMIRHRPKSGGLPAHDSAAGMMLPMEPDRAHLTAFYQRYIQRSNEHRFAELGEFVDQDVEVNGARRSSGVRGRANDRRAGISRFPLGSATPAGRRPVAEHPPVRRGY